MTSRVCAQPGCAELAPCPRHSRPKQGANPWGPDHNPRAHMALRRRLLKERGARCERCGWQSPNGKGLAMHHVRPGYDPSAVLMLCRSCHREIDVKAR